MGMTAGGGGRGGGGRGGGGRRMGAGGGGLGGGDLGGGLGGGGRGGGGRGGGLQALAGFSTQIVPGSPRLHILVPVWLQLSGMHRNWREQPVSSRYCMPSDSGSGSGQGSRDGVLRSLLSSS